MKLTSHLRIPVIAMLLLITGCSTHNDLPAFTASGYLADRGAVRIWRKNSEKQTVHMQTIFTPFSGGAAETTDYQWVNGKLVAIERHVGGKQPDDVTLRFADDGKMSFMQRQLVGRREALTEDAVALYVFDAGRMLKISDDLLAGRVVLIQGHWAPDGTVISCQDNTLRPDFDSLDREYLSQQQKKSPSPLNIAWLEAPGDTQLLLVSPEDFCKSEPREATF